MPESFVNPAAPLATAWFGKLPSAADFVGRRMPHTLESEWDNWIRSGIDQLRHEGGARWQERFVRGPVWFFMHPTLVPGVFAAGAIAPSIDRVGRHYPITVMALRPTLATRFADDAQVGLFFAAARSAILDARRIPLSADQLDERVGSLGTPFESRSQPPDSLIGDILSDLQAASETAQNPAVNLPGLEWRTLFAPGEPTSVWWVSPTLQFRHDLVVHRGPLHRPLFARLFKGPAA